MFLENCNYETEDLDKRMIEPRYPARTECVVLLLWSRE